MSKVNVRLNEMFAAPGNVLVKVTSVLVADQNVVVGNFGILPGTVSLRTDLSGFAQFVLELGRYRIEAGSAAASGSGLGYRVFIDVPDDTAEYEHTQLIVSGANPFSQPIPVTDVLLTVPARLAEIVDNGGPHMLTAVPDGDEVVMSGTVEWPDGSPGVYTTTVKNTTFNAIDAFTITHVNSGKTVTQAAVTRDAQGNVTAAPALTVT